MQAATVDVATSAAAGDSLRFRVPGYGFRQDAPEQVVRKRIKGAGCGSRHSGRAGGRAASSDAGAGSGERSALLRGPWSVLLRDTRALGVGDERGAPGLWHKTEGRAPGLWHKTEGRRTTSVGGGSGRSSLGGLCRRHVSRLKARWHARPGMRGPPPMAAQHGRAAHQGFMADSSPPPDPA